MKSCQIVCTDLHMSAVKVKKQLNIVKKGYKRCSGGGAGSGEGESEERVEGEREVTWTGGGGNVVWGGGEMVICAISNGYKTISDKEHIFRCMPLVSFILIYITIVQLL